MLIDWFTVGAQALNFLVLVWLMKRFLYKPILQAIDEREKRIATEIADADAKKAEAKKEQEDLTRKNEDFDRERGALLAKATDEAKVERKRLLDEAQEAADATSAKRRESLRTEAKSLNEAITRRAQKEVFAIARKALRDLATTGLEERLGDVLSRRLRELKDEAKEQLAQALRTASEPAVVRSAFELPPPARAVLQNALNETFSADVHVRFEVAPNVISGIELTVSGQKVGWSIAEYLTSLEEGVAALVATAEKVAPKTDQKAAPEVDAEPAPPATPDPKRDPEGNRKKDVPSTRSA